MILIGKVFCFEKLNVRVLLRDDIDVFVNTVNKPSREKEIRGHDNLCISKLGYDFQTLTNRWESHP